MFNFGQTFGANLNEARRLAFDKSAQQSMDNFRRSQVELQAKELAQRITESERNNKLAQQDLALRTRLGEANIRNMEAQTDIAQRAERRQETIFKVQSAETATYDKIDPRTGELKEVTVSGLSQGFGPALAESIRQGTDPFGRITDPRVAQMLGANVGDYVPRSVTAGTQQFLRSDDTSRQGIAAQNYATSVRQKLGEESNEIAREQLGFQQQQFQDSVDWRNKLYDAGAMDRKIQQLDSLQGLMRSVLQNDVLRESLETDTFENFAKQMGFAQSGMNMDMAMEAFTKMKRVKQVSNDLDEYFNRVGFSSNDLGALLNDASSNLNPSSIQRVNRYIDAITEAARKLGKDANLLLADPRVANRIQSVINLGSDIDSFKPQSRVSLGNPFMFGTPAGYNQLGEAWNKAKMLQGFFGQDTPTGSIGSQIQTLNQQQQPFIGYGAPVPAYYGAEQYY